MTRFRSWWARFSLAAVTLAVLAGPVLAADDHLVADDLVFSRLDGSPDDLDGMTDGIWTVPHGTVLGGRLTCGDAAASPCRVNLRARGDLEIRPGAGIEAADGITLHATRGLKVREGAFLVAERGDVGLSAGGRLEIDGLVAAGGARHGRALVTLRSRGEIDRAIRIGARGTVIAAGGREAGPQVRIAGCRIEVQGLVAAVGDGPGSSLLMDSCGGLVVGGRDAGAATGDHRGRLEVRGGDRSALQLLAADEVLLDGAELRVSGTGSRRLAVTSERGAIRWRDGHGEVATDGSGESAEIQLSACQGVDLAGTGLVPAGAVEVLERCDGVPPTDDEPRSKRSGTGDGTNAPLFLPTSSACTPGVTVNGMTLSTTQEFISCDVLTSQSTSIVSPASVTFRAKLSIELGNDFSVGTGAEFTAILDASLNGLPVGGPDAYDFVGNTLLLVDRPSSGGPEVLISTTGGTTAAADGVLDNDSDPAEMSPLSVAGIVGCADTTAPFGDSPPCGTANGGRVLMEANGQFSYRPRAGDTLSSDGFQYRLTDGVDSVDTAVTLNRHNRVWYVENDHTPNANPNDNGTSDDPFRQLLDAATNAVANDTIYVLYGDGLSTGQSSGIALKNGQRLLGEGVDLSVPEGLNGGTGPTTVFDSTANLRPKVSQASAASDAVSVNAPSGNRTGVEIRGLELSATRNAIDVTSGAGAKVNVTISDNLFAGSGSEAIDLNSGSSASFIAAIEDNDFSSSTGSAIDATATGAGNTALAINRNADVVSATGPAIDVDGSGSSGTLFVTELAGNSVHGDTGGAGISIVGAVFDADPTDADFDLVSGETTTVGSAANPVGTSGVVLGLPTSSATRAQGHLSFTQLDVFAASGSGLSAAGSAIAAGGVPPTSGFLLAAAAGTIESSGGPAIDLDPLTVDLTAQIDSQGGANGVKLDQVAGTFSFLAGSDLGGTTSHTGSAFLVTGGTVSGTYSGGVTQSTAGAKAIEITGNGGVLNFAGLITANTGTANAIDVTGNPGTVNFSGGLDVDTTTGVGFNATGGGTINVSLPGSGFNNVDSTQGVAVNLSAVNTSTGARFNRLTSGTVGTGSLTDGIRIDNLSGPGPFAAGSVTIANPADRGLEITNSSANFELVNAVPGTISVTVDDSVNEGIFLSSVSGSFTTGKVAIDGAGNVGLRVNGNTGIVNVQDGTIGATATNQGGVDVSGTGGSADVTIAAAITNTASHGVKVQNRNGGKVTFSGLVTANTGTSDAVTLTSNPGGTIEFSGGLDVDTTTGTGFNATGGGTINVSLPGSGFNNVDSTQGVAVNLSAVSTSTGARFNRLTSGTVGTGSLTDGIRIDNLSGPGPFAAGSVTIENSADRGLEITNSSANFELVNAVSGTISVTVDDSVNEGIFLSSVSGSFTTGKVAIDGAGNVGLRINGNTGIVNVQDGTIGATATNQGGVDVSGTGGSADVTIAAAITNTASHGVKVQNRNGGKVTFSGLVTANTGTSDAVTLANNIGGTIEFSGGLDVDTTTGTGFNATGGGTVNVSLPASGFNNIDSIQGVAVNLSAVNTSTGARFNRLTSGTLGTGSLTDGIRIDNLSGPGPFAAGSVTIENPADRGLEITNSSANFELVNAVSGTTSVSIDDSASDGLFLSMNSGQLTFGAVDVVNPGSAGIQIDGTSNATFAFDAITIDLQTNGSTGIDLSNAVVNNNFSATDFDLTATISIGTVAVDLGGTTGFGTIRLGDTLASGEDATIGAVGPAPGVGIRFTPFTNTTFVFGDGENTVDVLSSISAIVPISGGLPPSGSYNLLDLSP